MRYRHHVGRLGLRRVPPLRVVPNGRPSVPSPRRATHVQGPWGPQGPSRSAPGRNHRTPHDAVAAPRGNPAMFSTYRPVRRVSPLHPPLAWDDLCRGRRGGDGALGGRLGHLRRSDCYRLKRPVAGWELHLLKIAAFSRCTTNCPYAQGPGEEAQVPRPTP